jgi:hypothetical protein
MHHISYWLNKCQLNDLSVTWIVLIDSCGDNNRNAFAFMSNSDDYVSSTYVWYCHSWILIIDKFP